MTQELSSRSFALNPDVTKWANSNALGSAEIRAHWRDHFNHPPCFNDLGCFRVGPDPTGIFHFMMPPFSGKGEGTALLYIDESTPAAEGIDIGYQWFPDRVERNCEFKGLKIESTTRALSNLPGASLKVKITNATNEKVSREVGLKLGGRLIHTIGGWASIGPEIGPYDEHIEKWEQSSDGSTFVFSSDEKAWQVQGTSFPPHRSEGKMMLFDLNLEAGESWTLDFFVCLGESKDEAQQRYDQVTAKPVQSMESIHVEWDKKIDAAFQPDNSLYSGNLPGFVGGDEGITRLWYMSTLGCLALRRDNPISSQGPVYVTLSPNYWTTASFLWDMMISAPFYAMLDPDLLRKHIEIWLTAGVSINHATDYVTGKPIGNWYAVNSTAIVRLTYDYLRYTGDFEWLEKNVAGKRVLDHVEEHALMWHTYDKYGHGLADCGGVINLLECVTTYTHGVASFNAMWVAALRQCAELHEISGNASKAQELRKDASGLLQRVMELYVGGKGYWRCKQPDGSLTDVHHIYDFVAVLESITHDLDPSVREEMFGNFRKNHQTDNWVRSLTVWDDDSHREVRVDHQWTGSYTSIAAQSINCLCKIGKDKEAAEWLEKISAIALQGPVGQAHWVAPLYPNFKGGVWKASYIEPYITDWVCSSNGVYPAMIVESMFGVNATLKDGLKWKGFAKGFSPDAKLEHLPYQGKYYTVDKDGIHPESG